MVAMIATDPTTVWIGRHPIIDHLVDHLDACYRNPPQESPWRTKDRRGWFGASSLKSKKKGASFPYSPRRMMKEYLGLAEPLVWNEALWFGTYFDMVTDAALQTWDRTIETQPVFCRPELHFRVTPDLLFDDCGLDAPADVKALMFFAWRWLADPDYDPRGLYFYRQLQSQAWCAGSDSVYAIGYKRDDKTNPVELHRVPKNDLRRRFVVRRIERDDACIADIQRDLRYLCDKLPACEAALASGDPAALELALPVDI